MVPGQQPAAQRQQNKGGDSGLQEAAGREAHTHLHWGHSSGESQLLQIPWHMYDNSVNYSNATPYNKIKVDYSFKSRLAWEVLTNCWMTGEDILGRSKN